MTDKPRIEHATKTNAVLALDNQYLVYVELKTLQQVIDAVEVKTTFNIFAALTELFQDERERLMKNNG